MKQGYLNVTPLPEAQQLFIRFIDAHCRPLPSETIPVAQACGRILAKAVYATISAPHFYASAMDGVAMRAADGFGATETTPIVLHNYLQVDTGDAVPDAYDCVVMIEDIIDEQGVLSIVSAPTPWQNIRQIGEDICQGEMAFPTFTALTPVAAGTLVSCGVTQVAVLKKPLVGIIPTGDEVVKPTASPQKGDILEFNSLIYEGMLGTWGALTKTYPIVPDDADKIRQAVACAAQECDIVLLIAGSSKGRGDFAYDVLCSLGNVLLHGVAIRPGKPVILAEVNGRPVIGTPGYPVSGVIALRELLRPAIAHMMHTTFPDPPVVQAILGRKIVSPLQYQEFIRCKLNYINNQFVAIPLGAGASIVSSFARADGILQVAQNTELLAAGAAVEIELTREKSVIQKTVSVVGSHDPLLDELADLIEAKSSGIHLSSSHVGSMGAVMALKRGEAHIGGLHLLDPQTGRYNITYLQRYFSKGDVRLMRGVGRQQGLMVAKNNPLCIQNFQDIADKGLRFVNRQNGAGTRILLDYLLKKQGIAPELLNGYCREEMTHLSVAVQIASGGADAGLGIYSAAKAFDLHFIPVFTERYDFLVDTAFASDLRFLAVHKVLFSPEMLGRIEALGGYTTDGIGEWIDWEAAHD